MPLRGAQLIIKAVPFPGCSQALELREGLEYRRGCAPCTPRNKESFLQGRRKLIISNFKKKRNSSCALQGGCPVQGASFQYIYMGLQL